MVIKKAAGQGVRVGLRGRFETPNLWMLGVIWLCIATSAAAQTPSAPQPFVEEWRQQERERALREQQESSVDARLPREAPAAAAGLPEAAGLHANDSSPADAWAPKASTPSWPACSKR